MLKYALKISFWVFGVIVALVFTVYLVFWIVNLHDQAPSELTKYFESNYSNRVKISDRDNAFVYLMGLPFAQDEDPTVWGAKRIALIQQAADEEIDDLSIDPIMKDYLYKNIRSPAIEKFLDAFQLPMNENFYSTLEKNNTVISEWINLEAWLLARYLKLLTYKQYQEYTMTNPATPLPHYGVVMDAQKLFLTNVWLQAEQGNSENVKNLLQRDAVYWRMVLASSDMLISKMIAAAALKRHFIIGNVILKKLSVQTPINAIPDNWKIPFTKTELSMLQTFNGEWIFQDRIFKKIKQKSDLSIPSSFHEGEANWFDDLVLPFFQVQDISNKQANAFKKLVDALDVPSDKYIDVTKKLEENLRRDKKLNVHIYNATGEYLRSLGEPENGIYFLYIPYFSRVNDLESIRQAAVLTSELRNQSLNLNAIPDYITRSAYHNPYTLKPFEWDSKSKMVKFTGLEAGERGSYSFAY